MHTPVVMALVLNVLATLVGAVLYFLIMCKDRTPVQHRVEFEIDYVMMGRLRVNRLLTQSKLAYTLTYVIDGI